ncbi:hypothetical protein Z3_237 [Bacillus phage Z3]|nr:hypothetical protein Z3_237 [Bacillus phage Z3]
MIKKNVESVKDEGRGNGMNKWVTILLHNIGIIALTGFVFYLTRNYWTLAILICLASSKEDN